MEIPTLTTTRLRLRPFRPDDAAPFHQILSGESVLRYFPAAALPPLQRMPAVLARIDQHWHDHGCGLWAVEIAASGQLAGRCGLQYLPEVDGIEIDYIIGRPFWGQGIATEAATAAIQYGLHTLNLPHITGIAHIDNIASQRVLAKLGMARLAQADFFGIPCYQYQLTPDQPLA